MSLLNREWLMNQLGYGDTYQDKIDFCIEWITSRAESYIARKLESDTYTWYIDGNGASSIILPVTPVTAITSISIDASRSFTTNLETDEYYLNEQAGIVYLYHRYTPIGVRIIKVVATAGYTSDTLPGDLKMAFISAISHHMAKLINKSFGMSSITSPDGVNASYELELPSDTKRILDSYREVHI